ncbi:hypothetical protein K432DRAFT_380841 [Lepidopterella palustris CBS 459.81]|uniref:Cora-domain-containing protein n=1 Tax=Lepidopterella palustris CBS 459.81 TaxID=1314670 RepID=A0A8E2JGT0_9PEZI|nr:hypothetical protein K432DRAFT_380841 [Lepidopterella palustris CBS 459.81]
MALRPHHPEISDEDDLDKRLELHGVSDELKKGGVDVCEAVGDEIRWHCGADEDFLIRMLQSHNGPPKPERPQVTFRAFFFKLSSYDRIYGPSSLHVSKPVLKALQAAGMPAMVLSAIYEPEGVWAKMGDAFFLDREAESGKVLSSNLSYRYTFGWDNSVSYTHFSRTLHLRTYFCMNYPAPARTRLETYLRRHPELVQREWFIDALAADEGLKAWQGVVGTKRRLLVDFERQRSRQSNMDAATEALHLLSRDWHTLLQDLSDFSAQLQFLRNSYAKYLNAFENSSQNRDEGGSSNIDESFEVLDSRCNIYRRWVVNYRDRTNIRINLLFHLANQASARTSTKIALATASVAEQTQRDSASMITIAAVTMLFLPGTFVSAILSSTFFQYDAHGLGVSNKWWILPATTLPLMVIVFAVWFWWQRVRIAKAEKLQREAKGEVGEDMGGGSSVG